MSVPALRGRRTGARCASTRLHWWTLVPTVLLSALGLCLLGAAPATAHASLVGSDPAEGAVLGSAPAQATLTFDEPIRVQTGTIHLFDAAGTQLDTEAHTEDRRLVVRLPATMAEGTYVLAWRIVSADSHPVSGALTFSVGSPSTTVTPGLARPQVSPPVVTALFGVVQAAVYLGAFAATGLLGFGLLLPSAAGLDPVRARIRRIARHAGSAAILAGLALLPLAGLSQRGEGLGGLLRAVTWSDPLRQAEGVAFAVLTVGLVVATRARHPRAVLAGAVVALGSLAIVGHPRSSTPVPLAVAADVSHVLAGAAWTGGLLGLVLVLPRLAGRPGLAARVLSRFSTVAAWLLGTVALTGGILAWRILRSWAALLETGFGRLLLVKLAIVALVATVAGWNRYRLVPTVSADSGHAGHRRATGLLRRAVMVEATLLVAVLGVTGFLVDRSPVAGAGTVRLPGGLDAFTSVGQGSGVKVVASVRPGTVGANDVLLQIQDPGGEPLEPYAVPEVSLAHSTVSLGSQALQNTDSGTYRASMLIPRAGTWELRVSVRLSRFDNPVVVVRVPVKPAAASPRPPDGTAPTP